MVLVAAATPEHSKPEPEPSEPEHCRQNPRQNALRLPRLAGLLVAPLPAGVVVVAALLALPVARLHGHA